MQSFALFSPLIYFTPLLMTLTPFPFFWPSPCPWLLWYYFPFIICFPYVFCSSHFSTFPNLLPISFFPYSLAKVAAKVAKITLARQGRENQTVLVNEPSLSWLQDGAGLEDLVQPQQLLRKWKQEKAKGWVLLLSHLPTEVWSRVLCRGGTAVICTSRRVWAFLCQWEWLGAYISWHCLNYKW